MSKTVLHHDIEIISSLISILVPLSFGAVLLMKAGWTPSKKYLCWMFMLYVLTSLLHFIFDRYVHNYVYDVFRLLDVMIAMPVMFISYLYFASLLNPDKNLKPFIRFSILSYTLLLLISLVLSIFYGTCPNIMDIKDGISHIDNPMVLLCICAVIFLLLYEAFCLWNIVSFYNRYGHSILHEKSLIEKKYLRLVLIVIILFFMLSVLFFCSIVYYHVVLRLLLSVVSPLFLSYIFYLGFKQEPPAIHKEDISKISFEPFATLESHDKSSILKERIQTLFETDKPFLNKDLKMEDIAYALNTNRSYVSQLLNKDYNSSFYSYVNLYRIKYSVELMKVEPGLTIDYYAEASGFKSRSVFFSEFKKTIGCTPYVYAFTMGYQQRMNDKKNIKAANAF